MTALPPPHRFSGAAVAASASLWMPPGWTSPSELVYDGEDRTGLLVRRCRSRPAFSRWKMPLVYRAMLADGDRPQVGQTALSLGVRVPPDENADVAVSADGMAEPRSGGMSVAPAWRMLPVHRI